MRNIKIPRWRYIICFLIFYILSGSPYMTVYSNIRNIIYIGILLLVLSLNLRIRNKTEIENETILISLCLICIIIGLIHNEAIMLYISLCATFVFSYLFSKACSMKYFVKIFQEIFIRISIVDLLFYFVLQYIGQFSAFPEIVNSNGVVYKIGFIFNYMKNVPIRNCGVFWEPGLYATAIIISLLFEYIFVERMSYFRIIVLHICMFTTFSSAGIVLLLICDLLLLKEILYKFMEKRIAIVVLSVFLVALVILLLNSDSVLIALGLNNHEFYYKLMSSNTKNSSRVLAISHNMELFRTNPLLGAGIVKSYANTHLVEDTSTTTFMMSELGIIGVIPTIGIIYSVFKQHISYIEKIIIVVMLLIIINKEPHMNLVLIWTLMFYMINEKIKDDG